MRTSTRRKLASNRFISIIKPAWLRWLTRLGMPDRLVAHATRPQQLAEVGLDPIGIAASTRDAIRRAHLGSPAWVGARDDGGRLVATAREKLEALGRSLAVIGVVVPGAASGHAVLFEEQAVAVAWRDRLREMNISACCVADEPPDRFGRGDIYLVVPPEEWSRANEIIENLND